MALKQYQTELELDILYEISADSSGTEQLKPNLFIKDGTVDIYGSQSATEPTTIGEMVLNSENTNVSDISGFGFIPRYIFIQQNTGVTTEIVVSGVQVNNLGGF